MHRRRPHWLPPSSPRVSSCARRSQRRGIRSLVLREAKLQDREVVEPVILEEIRGWTLRIGGVTSIIAEHRLTIDPRHEAATEIAGQMRMAERPAVRELTVAVDEA